MQAVRRALGRRRARVVLAVSGGCDSMVLLHAALRSARDRVAAVATFNHGTGAAADRAEALACQAATALGVPVVAGHAPNAYASEAAWRAQRWEFLRGVSARVGGVVVTAHTRDDQVETVFMRVLRGAGARGLAGLYADSPVLRPLLGVTRRELRAVASAWGVPFVEDPANESSRYLRNRVRRDLLPAMRSARPDLDEALLSLARRAAANRRTLDRIAKRLAIPARGERRGIDVAAADLAGYSRESLCVLWPALAAHAGVTLDRRGTERLAAFTISSSVGRRVQVSGGWELYRARERFQFRPPEVHVTEPAVALTGQVRFGDWTFVPGPGGHGDAWSAVLPAGATYAVRAWHPGDRMRVPGAAGPRKVKRFLSDAGVVGARRAQWPVVVAGDEVVWIPGVRRSDAATDGPGRPGISYHCELDGD